MYLIEVKTVLLHVSIEHAVPALLHLVNTYSR